MTTLDQILSLKYKQIVGLDNIQTISNNTTIFGNVTIGGSLFNSNQSILIGNVSMRGNLYISGTSILLGNVTLGNKLTILQNNLIRNNATIISNLYITNNSNINNNLNINGNAIFNSNVSIASSLNISGNSIFQNGINVSNIQTINNNPLNIYGNIINIGNTNSVVNFLGNANYIGSNTDIKVADKLISLNLNTSTGSGIDNGNQSGIEILGTSGNGYIRTDSTATRFEIKPPIGSFGYIQTTDMNNNLFVSGTTTLYNNVTLLSSLNISSNTNINNSATINNSLTIFGNSLFNNSITINTNLYISSNTIIQNNITTNANINILGNSILNGFVTINSNLLVNGNTIFNNNANINSSLYVSSKTIIYGNTTVNGSLYNSGNNFFQGNNIINDSLYISGNTILNNNVSILSKLLVSNNSTINGNITLNSNLNVSGASIINGTTTIGSNLGYLNILSQISSILPEYSNNMSAAGAGVPLWGFYRTGGVIKIRLQELTPNIYFTGGTTLSGFTGKSYTDLGAYALDTIGNNIPVYLVSVILISDTINLLSNIKLITGSSTLVTLNSKLSTGTYVLTYSATDSSNNTSYNTRNINIKNSNISVYNFNLPSYPNLYIVNNYSILRTSNWTIETYIYINNNEFGNNIIILDLRSVPWVNNNNSAYFLISSSLNLGYWNSNSGFFYTNNTPLTTNTWYHIAWQKNNSNMEFYVNGTRIQTTNIGNLFTSSVLQNLNSLNIGGSVESDSFRNNLSGSLNQLTISSILRYSNTFIPSKILLNDLNTIFFLGNNFMDSVTSIPLTNTYLPILNYINSNFTNLTIPPIITLKYSSIYSNLYSNSFIDPGVTAIDYLGNNVPVYMIFLGTNSINLLSNNILINGTTTLIFNASGIPLGTYNIIYQATDINDNISYTYRTLNIINPIASASTPLTPYTSNMMIVSYLFRQSFQLQPVYQTSPNLWYWPSPYNTNGFPGGNGASWTLSSQYLASVEFKYNSSWCFVCKALRTNRSSYNLQINFDSNLSQWGRYQSAGYRGGSQILSIERYTSGNDAAIGFNRVDYINNSDDSMLDIGAYINISFNYLNSTSTDNGYLKVEICDLSGNLLFTNTANVIMNYTLRNVPFSYYFNNDAYTFLTGVYYNSTGYVNYNTFKSYI